MDLANEFPPNGNAGPVRRRPTDKDLVPVAKARRPKGSTKSFFGGNTVNQIKSYLISDVLIPAVKDFVEDSILAILDNVLHPDTSNVNYSKRSGLPRNNNERIRYDQVSKRSNLRSVGVSDSRKSPEDYNNLVYASRGEAEVTLRRLYDIVSEFGVASVYDYYKLNSVTGEWSTDKYGWDIDSFPDPRSFGKVRHVPGGYSIILPRVSVIE
jgi:hypothetical protein